MNATTKTGSTKVRFLLGLFLIGLFPLGAAAQDSHYWSHQYGMQGNLLGGLVIGSVTGLAGTYYNPGSLPFITSNDIIVASKVFDYSSVTLKNLAGTSGNVNYSRVNSAPAMLAGTIKLRGLGNHWLGYCYMARQSVDLDISGIAFESLALASSPPISAQAAINYQLSERLTETWWGLTWAYKVSPSLGVGISQFVTVRAHHTDFLTGTDLGLPDGHVATATNSRSYYYLSWRLLWKAGAIWDTPRLTLGATLTTPSLGLYGRGYSGINNTGANLQPAGVSPTNYLEADYQSGLKAGYRTPLSLGAGGTVKFEEFRIYASAEWFGRVNQYAVMAGKSFVGQTSGATLPNVVTNELKSVLNYGAGIEYIYRTDLKFYGSFRTDRTARPVTTPTNLSPADWDIYEFAGGAAFKVGNSSFALGLGLDFGRRQAVGGPGVFPAVIRPQVPGLAAGQEFSYSGAKLILGFGF